MGLPIHRAVFDLYFAFCMRELRRRLEKKIKREPQPGCWIWTASLNAYGYGQFSMMGTNRMAHRVVYELVRGPIPAGMTLDHLCRVRRCVNPDHLEPVTYAENKRRGLPWHFQRGQTHCKRGHAFEGENLIIVKRTGQRICRACQRIRNREHRAKNPGPGRNLEGLKLGSNYQKAKTHCPKGHPYAGENLGLSRNRTGRVCLACNRTRHNEANRKKREMRSMSVTSK